MIPQLNEQLAAGIQLPDSLMKLLAEYDIEEVMEKAGLDYMSLGLLFDL